MKTIAIYWTSAIGRRRKLHCCTGSVFSSFWVPTGMFYDLLFGCMVLLNFFQLSSSIQGWGSSRLSSKLPHGHHWILLSLLTDSHFAFYVTNDVCGCLYSDTMRCFDFVWLVYLKWQFLCLPLHFIVFLKAENVLQLELGGMQDNEI